MIRLLKEIAAIRMRRKVKRSPETRQQTSVTVLFSSRIMHDITLEGNFIDFIVYL
jgi:hypothetical protein